MTHPAFANWRCPESCAGQLLDWDNRFAQWLRSSDYLLNAPILPEDEGAPFRPGSPYTVADAKRVAQRCANAQAKLWAKIDWRPITAPEFRDPR